MTYKLPLPERTTNASTLNDHYDIDNHLSKAGIDAAEQDAQIQSKASKSIEEELKELKQKVKNLEGVERELVQTKEQLKSAELNNAELEKKASEAEVEQKKAEEVEEQYRKSLEELERLTDSIKSIEQQLKEESESFVLNLSLKLLEDFQGLLTNRNVLKNSLLKKFDLDTEKVTSAVKISKQIASDVQGMEQFEVAEYLKGFTIEVSESELVTLVDYDGYFKRLSELLNG